MAEHTIEQVVEALVFASSEPVTAERIASVLDISPETVASAVEALNSAYEMQGRSFRILMISGGYQHRTLPDFAEQIRSLGRQVAAGKMSLQALETLAIIAYRQPISRAEVDKIRGVNASGVIKTLIEKKLVTVTGRAQVLGRPLLYGTTAQFLRHFGLAGLDQLPRESELQVLLEEHSGPAADKPAPAPEAEASPPDGEQRILM